MSTEENTEMIPFHHVYEPIDAPIPSALAKADELGIPLDDLRGVSKTLDEHFRTGDTGPLAQSRWILWRDGTEESAKKQGGFAIRMGPKRIDVYLHKGEMKVWLNKDIAFTADQIVPSEEYIDFSLIKEDTKWLESIGYLPASARAMIAKASTHLVPGMVYSGVSYTAGYIKALEAFVSKVKDSMIQCDASLADIANLTTLSTTTIRNMLNFKHHPRLYTVSRCAQAFGWTWDELAEVLGGLES